MKVSGQHREYCRFPETRAEDWRDQHSVVWDAVSCLEARGKTRGDCKRRAHAGDTDCPPETVEQLAENCAADKATEEVAREIDAACNAAVFNSRLPDKSSPGRLCEESSGTNQNHTG